MEMALKGYSKKTHAFYIFLYTGTIMLDSFLLPLTPIMIKLEKVKEPASTLTFHGIRCVVFKFLQELR